MNLSHADFLRLSNYLNATLGIKLPEAKRNMLAGRLNKRLRILQMDSFSAYCDFVFSSAGHATEAIHLLDAVTTNKTDFFREPNHFNYLTRKVLPGLTAGGKRNLRFWSAGCSTGEEPYTLAMVLSDYRQANHGLSFDILATDISTKVLDIARQAIYGTDRVEPVPPAFRQKFLLKGKEENCDLVRIIPELRARVCFGRLNFMAADFRLPAKQHVVFCRNVLIYFDKKTQEHVINKICQYLEPDGYLFLGHSETILGYSVPLVQEAPTIYRRLA